MSNKYTEEELLEKLKNVIEETGKVPTTRDAEKLDIPSVFMYRKFFSSWNNVLELLGYNPHKKRYTKEELLQILKDYKEKTGKVPAYNTFEEDESLPSTTPYKLHFGSWNNALIEAGITPNKINHELDELLQTYMNDRKGKIAKSTIKMYITNLSDFSNFLKSKEKTWKDLTSEDVVEYFEYLKDFGSFSKLTNYSKPNSPQTLEAKATSIRAFLSWTEKWCKRKRINPPIIDPAEIEEIRDTLKSTEVIPPSEESSRRALMKEEIEQIRSVITDPIERLVFDLGLNLGVRVSEFDKITMDMVLGKPEERRPRLNGSEPIPRFEREHYIEVKGKGNKTRFIVLTDEMKVLIKKQLLLRKLHRVEHDRFFFSLGKMRRTRLNSGKIYKIYDKLSEDSGIYFRQHDLRYTMSVLFQRKGIEQSLVAQRLGHKGSITQRYSRASIIDRYKLFQEKVGII
jgi:site-specific recombinase XerD